MPNDTVVAGARTDGAAGAARALREPVRVPLPELGVIAVSGADHGAFLQSQLTNDVAQLGAAQMQLNGYCTAKGRLLATFHQWRHGDAVLLRLPREVLPGVLKRLEDGTLHDAVNRLTEPGMAIARDTRSVDAALRWSTIAGDHLGLVVDYDLHKRGSADDFTTASLTRILALDD